MDEIVTGQVLGYNNQMNLASKIDETSSRLLPNSTPPRSASEVKNLLKEYAIRPSRGLGQNFLIDKTAVRGVVTAADLKPEDLVLEVGPGLGVLTQELAKTVKMVIAVEKDPKMVAILKETLKNYKNIEIIREDILKFQITNYKLQINPKYQITNYKVVASLPFYLAASVIRKFLEFKNPPESMTLIIQKEVAQRVAARPPKMNLLAVSVQFYAEPKIINYISKKSFWPQPKVDGAIIKIQTSKSKSQNIDKGLFFKIVKAGFSQPRKLLINNLSKKLKVDKIKVKAWLWKSNIQSSQRAETLNIENWISLAKNFNF